MSYVSGGLKLEDVAEMEAREKRLKSKLRQSNYVKHVRSGLWEMVTEWQACPIGSVYSAPQGRQWDVIESDNEEYLSEQLIGGHTKVGEKGEGQA